MTVVLRDAMVRLLMLVEIEFKFVLLVLDNLLGLSKLRNGFKSLLFRLLDVVEGLQVLIDNFLFVLDLSIIQFLEANVVFVSLGSLILINLIRKLVRCCNARVLICAIILILLIDLHLILLILLRELTDFLDVVLACFLSDGPDFVIIVLLVTTENVRGLHRTTSFGTQEALDHLSSLEAENGAIVAYPVDLRDRLKPKT